MKARSAHTAAVARELALTLSDGSVRPHVVVHVSGVVDGPSAAVESLFVLLDVSVSLPMGLCRVNEVSFHLGRGVLSQRVVRVFR